MTAHMKWWMKKDLERSCIDRMSTCIQEHSQYISSACPIHSWHWTFKPKGVAEQFFGEVINSQKARQIYHDILVERTSCVGQLQLHCPVKQHHPYPKHSIPLIKADRCPVNSLYTEASDEQDQRRWFGGLIIHPKSSNTGTRYSTTCFIAVIHHCCFKKCCFKMPLTYPTKCVTGGMCWLYDCISASNTDSLQYHHKSVVL